VVRPFAEWPTPISSQFWSQQSQQQMTVGQARQMASGMLAIHGADEPDAVVAVVVPPGRYDREDYVRDAELDRLYAVPALRDMEFDIYAYPGNEAAIRDSVFGGMRVPAPTPKIVTHLLDYIGPGLPGCHTRRWSSFLS